jgi:hypothetical protein
MKEHKGMRPHDILVLLKIISLHSGWLNKDLSFKLHIAQSEISESLNRSAIAGLISPDKRKVFKNALLKFLEFGLPFVYPAEYGAIERGLPTAHSADVLKEQFISSEACVWPYANGNMKGHAIQPLYPSQVKAALEDQRLYDMLALVDSIRVGKAREKAIAIEHLSKYFNLDA